MLDTNDFETERQKFIEENEQLRKNFITKAKCFVVSVIALACAGGILSAVNRQNTEALTTLVPIVTAILGFIAGKLT